MRAGCNGLKNSSFGRSRRRRSAARSRRRFAATVVAASPVLFFDKAEVGVLRTFVVRIAEFVPGEPVPVAPIAGPMGVEFHADGDWAACPACAALAVRGDRERLARRSARGFFKRHPEITAGLDFDDYVAHVRRLQDTFWANRSGTPFPSDDPRTRRAES